MEISNPRRILAVALSDSAQHLSNVIKDLTGAHPTPNPPHPPSKNKKKKKNRKKHHPNPPPPPLNNNNPPSSAKPDSAKPEPETTLAGTTHALPLKTPYYTASVPVWLDLVSSPAEWAASFLAPEAAEVLAVLGGVVVVFALPPLPSKGASMLGGGGGGDGDGEGARAKELVREVGRVMKEGLGGWEWDGVGLVVGVGKGVGGAGDGEELDEWEDLCAEWGMEFVHVAEAGVRGGKGEAGEGGERNEFGERMGLARVMEALEANDWSGGGMGAEGEGEEGDDLAGVGAKGERGEDEDDDFDPEKLDFGFDREDFLGLRKAIWSGGGDGGGEGSQGGVDEDGEVGEEDVQQLERMMMKLQAVRDASAGLPEEQRKRMAARAVGEVMREL
ncbi:alpha and gamma adaptin binding protein p34-domain-containing protein [Chaetomium sp. MPI-CAGE-AT-0009]|nr:alpha and gamma adaptin binding protein p34-domain-containing protein [Chaetomium sp. MPI-CAGE-AT-0009]